MHHAGNGMLTSAYIGAVRYVKALVIITLHSNVRAWLGQVTLFTSSLALYKKSTLILALGKTKNSAEERIIDSLLEL